MTDERSRGFILHTFGVLAPIRWPNGPICYKCGTSNPYVRACGSIYLCSNSECRAHFSILTGTIWRSVKKPLQHYVAIIDGLIAGGSFSSIATRAGISDRKWPWHFCQLVLSLMRQSDCIQTNSCKSNCIHDGLPLAPLRQLDGVRVWACAKCGQIMIGARGNWEIGCGNITPPVAPEKIREHILRCILTAPIAQRKVSQHPP